MITDRPLIAYALCCAVLCCALQVSFAAGDSGGGDSEEEVIDRAGIERNFAGSEEPHSSQPEIWNIDGAEMDLLAKCVSYRIVCTVQLQTDTCHAVQLYVA